MASSVDQLKSLGLSGLSTTGKYTREEMASYILAVAGGTIKTQEEGYGALMSHLIAMETRQNQTADDLRKLVNEVRVENKVIQDENKALHGQFERLMSVVVSQQRQLERLEAKERSCNLVVIGLPENGINMNEAKTDKEKLVKVFDKVCPGDEFTYTTKRLGDPRQDNSARPVLVTLPTEYKRREVLQNAQTMSASESLNNLKLKKDQHPAIRKEWRRMFDSETNEKQKPENVGSNIVFDKKMRVITRDGVVIDRFLPHF